MKTNKQVVYFIHYLMAGIIGVIIQLKKGSILSKFIKSLITVFVVYTSAKVCEYGLEEISEKCELAESNIK